VGRDVDIANHRPILILDFLGRLLRPPEQACVDRFRQDVTLNRFHHVGARLESVGRWYHVTVMVGDGLPRGCGFGADDSAKWATAMKAISGRLRRLEQSLAPKRNAQGETAAEVIRERRCRRLAQERGVPNEQVVREDRAERGAFWADYAGDGT